MKSKPDLSQLGMKKDCRKKKKMAEAIFFNLIQVLKKKRAGLGVEPPVKNKKKMAETIFFIKFKI